MKYVIATLLFTASVTATAATVPTGLYDCSRKVGTLHVEISATGSGYMMAVTSAGEKFNSQSKGFATIVSYSNEGGPQKNSIRLPGTNYAFYYDDNGNLGLNFDTLDCKRM